MRTIGVVKVESNGRHHHRLYHHDPSLPGLAVAVDAGSMAARLGAALGVELDACLPTPVRYRPGERAMLRYELRGGDRRFTVYGKLIGTGIERSAAILGDLDRAALRGPEMPEILPPLAVLPDLGLVVQARAAGRSLRDLLYGPGSTPHDGLRALHRAGRALAAFHACGVAAPTRRSLHHDVTELRAGLPDVARVDPGLAGRMESVVDGLAAVEASPMAGASHGSFRPDHLFLAPGGTTVVDLDGFCLAEPARDLGNLLAYVRWKAIRERAHAELAAGAQASLLEGYRAHGGGIERHRCQAHQAAAMLRISIRRFRNLSTREWPLVPQLVAAADEALHQERGTVSPMVGA